MGQRFEGRVVRVGLGGGSCASSHRMLAHLLDRTDGVASYSIDPTTATLTAFLDHTHHDDDAIARALVAAGMYPTSTFEVGAHHKDETNAC